MCFQMKTYPCNRGLKVSAASNCTSQATLEKRGQLLHTLTTGCMIKIFRGGGGRGGGWDGGSSEKHFKWGGGFYKTKMVWSGGSSRPFSIYFSKTFDI